MLFQHINIAIWLYGLYRNQTILNFSSFFLIVKINQRLGASLLDPWSMTTGGL